jgi:4'-phosphopantetheinyl transferase EntD
MIAEIVPTNVAVAEAFDDFEPVNLFPAEKAVIAKAVDNRRSEFATARRCARVALAKLGLPPVPIVPGLRGAPQWPAGVVGSITHCAGYRASAVARSRDIITIGLDAEPHDTLPHGVLAAVASADERARLAVLTGAVPYVHWDRLLFSAKESVYKAWFPLTNRWLGFEDAHVDLHPVDGTFTARLQVEGLTADDAVPGGFEGRWIVSGGLIITIIVVSRPDDG